MSGVFAADLRVARHRAGITQQQLAARLGVTSRTITNWERGITAPRNPVRVMDAFNNPTKEGNTMSNDYTIRELQARAGKQARAAGFRDQPRNFGERLALIHSELSEALEEARSGHPLDFTYESAGGKPEGVPSELADALIRILDLADEEGIDMADEVVRKLDYNATRPRKHGREF